MITHYYSWLACSLFLVHSGLIAGCNGTNRPLVASEPDTSQESGTVDLFALVKSGDNSRLRLVLEGIPAEDMNPTNFEGGTPLLASVIKGNFEAFSLLLEAGANPFIQDKRGRTAIRLAVAMPNTQDWLATLLNAGIDVKSPPVQIGDGSTSAEAPWPILHDAIGPNNILNVRILVEDCGVDIEERGPWGETPLGNAVGAHCFQIAHYLAEQGANLDAPSSDGKSIREWILECDGLFCTTKVDKESLDRLKKICLERD